jgi:RTX calcium-binding nonapeptide repeat (4 copies)
VSYDRLDAGVSVDLAHGTATSAGNPQDNLKGIETVSGSEYDDTLIGNSVVNTLIGNDGNDTLVGNAGDDFLNGGSGSDTADGGAGKADFCLDTEHTRRCEVKRRTGAGFNRSTSLQPSLAGAPFSRLGRAPLGKVGLGKLAQSTTQPTCKPLAHGKGVTSIGPPTTIYVPKTESDASVTWQAWLTRKGSGKRFMTITTAKATLLTPITARSKQKTGYRAYTPNDWHYLKNGKMVDRQIFSRPLPPGQYSWTERVDLPSGTFAQDRIPAYFRPPPKTGHAVPACKFS